MNFFYQANAPRLLSFGDKAEEYDPSKCTELFDSSPTLTGGQSIEKDWLCTKFNESFRVRPFCPSNASYRKSICTARFPCTTDVVRWRRPLGFKGYEEMQKVFLKWCGIRPRYEVSPGCRGDRKCASSCFDVYHIARMSAYIQDDRVGPYFDAAAFTIEVLQWPKVIQISRRAQYAAEKAQGPSNLSTLGGTFRSSIGHFLFGSFFKLC